MSIKSALQTLRHNAGEAFLHALDDIRHKVVEEGWTGVTQTPAHQVDHAYSDPLAALYGAAKSGPDRDDTEHWLYGGPGVEQVRALTSPGHDPSRDDTIHWLKGDGSSAPGKSIELPDRGSDLGLEM